MRSHGRSTTEELALVLGQCLKEGNSVEIDGLGTFRPTRDGRFEFVSAPQRRVFIAYADEDRSKAERLYSQLRRNGFDPWLDCRKLLPGQNWPRAIEEAIEVSDFVVVCFSRRAVVKRGHFQCELKYALDCARRMPLERTFVIPVRLEECPVPERIMRQIQYVDLFPDWDEGVRRVMAALRDPRPRREPGDSGPLLVG